MRTVWANCNYVNWNAHSLSQLQQFQAKNAESEVMASISTKTRDVAHHNYFKKTLIVWSDCNYFK